MFWRSFRLVERCSLKAEKNEAQHVASADTLLLSVIFSFSEVDCRCGSGCQIVAMMQAAEPGHRYNSVINTGILDCFTTGGRSLRQRKMSSVLVVVPDVLVHQAFQMAFVHNNYIVEQIPAAVADPSLGHAVPSVITLKPATCGQFKTGHFAWPRRDCFTLLRGAFARRDSSCCSFGRFSSRSDAW